MPHPGGRPTWAASLQSIGPESRQVHKYAIRTGSPTACMRVFFDTEFTAFRGGRLLSAGFISEDGREAYFEIPGDGLNRDCGDWVRANVLSQFDLLPDCAAGTLAGLGERVARCLLALGGPLELCCDHKLDERYLAPALQQSQTWLGVRQQVSFANIADELRDDADAEAAKVASFAASAPLLAVHHALADARALRAAWMARCTFSAAATQDMTTPGARS